MLLTIITFIIVLSILVFAHELGHFWVARKCGVRAKEFGFGFPPRAFGIYKNKEGKWRKVLGGKQVEDAADTVYSINWIPLGGFVNLGEDEEGGDDPNHFANKKIWQRASMISAGVVMNIILAAVLIIFGFMIGLPQGLDNISPRAQITDKKIQIVEVMPDSPAEKAGLRIGDVIASINGNAFAGYQELQEFVDEHVGEELEYLISREGGELTVRITPRLMEETGRGGIGVGIMETGIVKYPFFLAIWEGVKTTIFLTWAIIIAFYELIKGLIIGQGVSADVAGPVGIAALTGQVARMGFVYVLQFTALLSINLAIINFLPFPALDGGRIIFLIIEKIKGSPVKKEIEGLIHNIGFALLMLLILVVTFKDVSRFGDKFRMIWERIIG
jgi:regulator of sigma E protease